MRKLLVTGLIGAGKSVVCSILESRYGVPIYYSDSRTKALYSPELIGRLEAELGVPFEQFEVIFSDEAKRQKLESIVYPLVLKDFRSFCEAHSKSPLVAMESAVAGSKEIFSGEFDIVLEVRASDALRELRNPKASSRSAVQKALRPHRVDCCIDNNADIDALRASIDSFICNLSSDENRFE